MEFLKRSHCKWSMHYSTILIHSSKFSSISYTLRIVEMCPVADTISVESLEKCSSWNITGFLKVLHWEWSMHGKFHCVNLHWSLLSFLPVMLEFWVEGISLVWILLGAEPDLGWVHSWPFSVIQNYLHSLREGNFSADGLEAGKGSISDREGGRSYPVQSAGLKVCTRECC